MNYVVVSCLLAVTASASADAPWGGLVYAPKHASVDYYAYPKYAFEYSVKDPHTGDNKAQWEMRDGDVVKGSYSLVEPGGSLRIVDYWADSKSGFNANVRRVGHKVHPVAMHAAPVYKAQLPILTSAAVGPIDKLGGLVGAPILTGPALGGAISTTSVIKTASPIIAAPGPVLKAPIYPAPILSAPILPAPVVKAPIYPAYTPSYLTEAYPALKAPLGLAPYGDNFYRAPLASYGLLSDGLLGKGFNHAYPANNGYVGYSGLAHK